MKDNLRLVLKLLVVVCSLTIIAAGLLVKFTKSPRQTRIPVRKEITDTVFVNTNGNAGDSATLDFSEPEEINILELTENGNNIQSFSIFAMDDNGSYNHIYTQDFIGEYRACQFPKTVTKSLKITINETKKNMWEITSAKAFLHTGTFDDDFRVTAYVVFDRIQTPDKLDPEHFKIINNINLSFVYFTQDGEIVFRDYDINGKTVPGEEAFSTAVSNLRRVIQPKTKLIPVFLGQDITGSLPTPYIHTKAMTENKEALKNNLLAFVNKYELDGISFDYEYPETAKDSYNFFSFISYLKENVPANLTISTAKSTWEFAPLGLSATVGKMYNNLDVLELMTYDYPSYHSTYSNACYNPIKQFEDLRYNETSRLFCLGDEEVSVDFKKINLGLPFYSRPTDNAGYWGDYAGAAANLGKYTNLIDMGATLNGEPIKPEYYNSYQMIYDKVCYAIDKGLGGVMVWHYSCDIPMSSETSLFRAISDAIESRK